MSPLYSLRKLSAELRSRIASEPDPFMKEILTEKLLHITRQETSCIVHIHSVKRVDPPLESYNGRKRITVPRVPIKSALRMTNHVKADKDHWYWDKLNAAESERLSACQQDIQNLFYTIPDKITVRLVFLEKGLNRALESCGLEKLSNLPEDVRRANGKALMKVFEEAIRR